MVSSMNLVYRVWRVGQGEPALIGSVDAGGYIEAVAAAQERYGANVQVYLPPVRPIPKNILREGCSDARSRLI